MRVDQCPGCSVARVLTALQEPHPRHDEGVVRPGMAELVPPILPDDFVRVNLVDTPEVSIALLIQVNSLEYVLVKGNVGWELALVVCAVEAHFELGAILRVHLDVVHWLKVFFGIFVALGLVDIRERFGGLLVAIEVLVVIAHVVSVPMCDGDVVGELCRSKDLSLAERGSGCKDAFGCVGTVDC